MKLQQRIDLLVWLGNYMKSNSPAWELAKEEASLRNPWFTKEFVELSTMQIALHFLDRQKLEEWIAGYDLPEENNNPKTVGIVMAGNIPLVGFHDFLCVFISGHRQLIKASSKDETLIRHIVQQLNAQNPEVEDLVVFADLLKNADAYIATGSNNSSRYFDYYFAKYPHIIRKSRTSVAVLDGSETEEQLLSLADDVHQYFGRGCRNVSKLYIPQTYNFQPLLKAFRKYNYLLEHHKYKNNFDYNLALLLLNKKEYMSTDSLLLVEEKNIAAPIGQLHYEHYASKDQVKEALKDNDQIQCCVGLDAIKPGQAQQPGLSDYADGIDSMALFKSL